jgi:hypothetical protein
MNFRDPAYCSSVTTRGRAMMRDQVFARVGASGKDAFPFMSAGCDRVVLGVLARLRELNSEA